MPSGADNPFYELRYWVGQRVSPGFLFVKVLWENLNEFITCETNEAPSGNRPDPSQDQWEKRASFTKGKNLWNVLPRGQGSGEQRSRSKAALPRVRDGEDREERERETTVNPPYIRGPQ